MMGLRFLWKVERGDSDRAIAKGRESSRDG